MPISAAQISPAHGEDSADRRRKALVLCISDPATDPRPRRVIQLLEASGFAVHVFSYPPSKSFAAFRHIPLPIPSPRLAARAARKLLYLGACALARVVAQGKIFEHWLDVHYGLHQGAQRIAAEGYDVMVVEDLALLPVAERLRGSAALIFDAREYYPRQNEDSALFRLVEGPARTQLCRDYLGKCDQVITVSPGLAAEFDREFGLRTEVILSTPDYRDMPVRPTAPDRFRMVHHGAANRNRRLEDLIEVTRRLDDRFELDIYLTGSPATIESLKRHAATCPRVRILPPVPYEAIIPTIAGYDIGLFFNIPTTFNLRNALPNKLFEFIQARLVVAIGPSPDMRFFVERYGCGVVAPDATVDSMADALLRLSASEIDRMKANSDLAARDLCFGKESEKLRHIIADAIDRRQKNGLDQNRVAASG